MKDLTIQAVSYSGKIQVTLNGFLSNSCWEAKVVGTYPGNIVHIMDPGYAEIFIEETKRPGEIICLQYMVPWMSVVNIDSSRHSKVVVYINGEKAVSSDINPEPNLFNVYGISGTVGPFGCRIVPEGSVSHLTHLFGPASREDCKVWIHNNCQRSEL